MHKHWPAQHLHQIVRLPDASHVHTILIYTLYYLKMQAERRCPISVYNTLERGLREIGIVCSFQSKDDIVSKLFSERRARISSTLLEPNHFSVH